MDYFEQFQGRFLGVMQWEDCYALLETLSNNPHDWYFYDTLKSMPSDCIDAEIFTKNIANIKSILDEEHQERYCGIVYTNDLKNPTFVKIFHPNNLGKVCGSSENPPMPQWLISKEKPMDVVEEFGEKEDEGFVAKYLKL